VLVALALQLNGLSSVPLLCAFFFFVGGMAAILPPLGSHRRILSGFLAMLIFCVAARYGIMRDVALIPWVILGILPFLLAALAGNWPGLDRWQLEVGVAGNLTYSTYLLHFPLQLLLAIIVAWTGIRLPLTSSLFLLAYIGITLTAAAVCYRRFELPAQNWLRRAENRGVSISFASACAAEK
jgi:peptidoglycan/LPS O-acetylase OafA/YrhL